MYADKITDSMRKAIDETNRRRKKQETYNEVHGIQPMSIVKAIRDITDRLKVPQGVAEARAEYSAQGKEAARLAKSDLQRVIAELERQMKTAAKDLEFEKAAALRDQIFELRGILAEESNLPPWQKARLLAGEVDVKGSK